jgi:hypothetical protein
MLLEQEISVAIDGVAIGNVCNTKYVLVHINESVASI